MGSKLTMQNSPITPSPRTSVLGVGVSAVDMRGTLRQCREIIESAGEEYVCTVDAHSVVEALRDSAHRKVLNRAFLTVADGMPIVWIGRIRGNHSMGHVYGPELM